MPIALNTCPCDISRNPVFVLQTPKQQVAANTVYQYKETYDAAQTAAGSNKVYTFKTDRERMQYKIGKFGLNSQGLA
jgi:ribosomal protein L3